MWGQLASMPRRAPIRRNTPTYVGTTTLRGNCGTRGSEHPHVCGNNQADTKITRKINGTPPRMWGQRPGAPAAKPGKPEHPHVCGDNAGSDVHHVPHHGTPPRMWGQLSSTGANTGAEGTPPRMWGQPRWRRLRLCLGRNTPTYVGTTIQIVGFLSLAAGTPLRMWGQLSMNERTRPARRNTPTYVGTTRGFAPGAGNG